MPLAYIHLISQRLDRLSAVTIIYLIDGIQDAFIDLLAGRLKEMVQQVLLYKVNPFLNIAFFAQPLCDGIIERRLQLTGMYPLVCQFRQRQLHKTVNAAGTKTNAKHMNRLRNGNQMGKFRHGTDKIGTIGMHRQRITTGICHFSERKNKIGASVRKDIEAHSFIDLTFKLPILVYIRR